MESLWALKRVHQGHSMQSKGTSTPVGSTSPERRLKLPRIDPLTNQRNSPSPTGGGANGAQRRFVTVVRPFSVFPDPPLPPNFTPSVSVINARHRSSSRGGGIGRPPSPAPFGRRAPGPIALNGVPVRGRPQPALVPPVSAHMRLNLAGGGGWDLTAIRRGYNTNQSRSPFFFYFFLFIFIYLGFF